MYIHLPSVDSLRENYCLTFDTLSAACLKRMFDLEINYWSYSPLSRFIIELK